MRIIAHLDMDAFFASVEEADSPIFAGKPIAVGCDPKEGLGRGVISTANYKAREYGIHSALPISQAWQLSQKAKSEGKPEVVFLSVNFKRYTEVSEEIFRIIEKHSIPKKINLSHKECGVEPASIDEFYFDLSFTKSFKKAKEICFKIKKEIKDKFKITCSIGLASNKLIAKISAGVKKPDGFLIVKQKDAESFLENMKIREIPGIGPKTEFLLNKQNVIIVKDLKRFTENDLTKMFGKWGADLYYKVRGIDNSSIVENRVVKSIGEQTTFEKDTLNAIYIGEIFEELCENVFERFKNSGFTHFKTISITVRFSGFETKTSAKTLKKPSCSKKDFKIESLKLLLPYLDKRKNPKLKLIRLLGVKLEKFENQNLGLGI
jgi:DNA polymerase IV (DinB-like DNA polymerase)